MKTSFRGLVAFGLCAALSTPALAAPQDGKMGGQMGGKMGGPMGRPGVWGGGGQMRGGPMRGMERMAKELGLTEAQQAKIKSMSQAQGPKMRALFENKSMTRDQKQAKMKAMREANMKQMNAILTPAQRKKLQAMLAQMMAQRGRM